MYKLRRWLCACLTFTLLPTTQALELPKVHEITLDNGMQLLVVPDERIPNATMQLFWRVGSRNEYPGTTGLAHFFEHMMFNGAKKYGPKQFDRVMEAAGGRNNAYTSENSTVYTNWFPAEALETIFDLEADRIANLSLSPKMVESERGVVTSERATGLENSNFRVLWEEVKGAAFRAHPYSWPIIGHASDIANWSQADLERFHQTYYAPNNALVVIVGDVELEQVSALAKQYFGPIPAQPKPREIHTVEPEQTGERRVKVHKSSVSSANLMLAYHVPQTSHADHYALSLLSDILTSGNSARLTQTLVFEQSLATELFSFMPDSIDPNLFYLYAVAADGVPAEQLEQALLAEIAVLRTEGISDKELQKAKNRQLVDLYRNLASIDGKAENLGTYAFYFGDYRSLQNAPDAIQAVTASDIQRVAKAYLHSRNLTLGTLTAEEANNDAE